MNLRMIVMLSGKCSVSKEVSAIIDQIPLLAGGFLMPVIIFFARVIDVSLGTIRIVSVSRGMRKTAGVLGFFEILIWISAMAIIMKNLTNFVNYIAYAGGFGFGNYVGLIIEQKLSLGSRVVRIITKKSAGKIITDLREEGYGATVTKAGGEFGPVSIIFSVVKRKEIYSVLEIINRHNPGAFYTIEDVNYARDDRLRYKPVVRKSFPFHFLSIRKSK